MQRGIISVDVFGLDREYLTWDEAVKQEVCKKIVVKAFESMKVPATKDERVQIMSNILDRSIREYEKIDEFESCIILSDIKKALTTL
jgi:hypothetical protein